MLVNQLVTGIWLTMNYVPSGDAAFASVEYIMRDVEFGWLIRYLHSTGASRFSLWCSCTCTGAHVRLLPRSPGIALVDWYGDLYRTYGGRVFWLPASLGQHVLLGCASDCIPAGAIPYVGADLMEWVRGDFLMSEVALNRFFALHVVALPIVLLGLVFVHFVALHHVGSNNPDGIEIKKNKDENGVPVDGIPSTLLHSARHSRDCRLPVPILCGSILRPRDGWLLYREA